MTNILCDVQSYMGEATTIFTYCLMGLAVLAGAAGIAILVQIARGKIRSGGRKKD